MNLLNKSQCQNKYCKLPKFEKTKTFALFICKNHPHLDGNFNTDFFIKSTKKVAVKPVLSGPTIPQKVSVMYRCTIHRGFLIW